MNWYVADPAREELAAWGIHEACAGISDLGEVVSRRAGSESHLLHAEGRARFRLRWYRDARPRGHAESEFRLLELLRARGLCAPEPVATASCAGGDSVLVLRDVPGSALEPALRDSAAGHARALQEALAAELRRWHDHGACHGQLFAWHVVVEGARVAFVDVRRARLHRPGRLSWTLRCRDWAALFATLPLAVLSSAARRRLLRLYGVSREELRRVWPWLRIEEVRWRRQGCLPRGELSEEWHDGSGSIVLSRRLCDAARAAGLTQAGRWLEPAGSRVVRVRDERRNRVWPRALGAHETWYGKEYLRDGARSGAGLEAARHRALEWLGIPVASVAVWAKVPGRSVLWTQEVKPGGSARDRLHAVSRQHRAWRRRALEEIAALARRLHAAGFSHRDLYLDHFLWEKTRAGGRWVLLDLARMQEFPRLPWRRRVKDLAALEYSARTAGISRQERARAFRSYWRGPRKERRRLLRAVLRRADRIQARELRKGRFPVPVPEAWSP